MYVKNLFSVAFVLILTYTAISQSSQNITLLDRWENNTLVPSTDHNNTYNETWGFVQDGVEYGVIGTTWGTHIFDLANPTSIVEVVSIKGEHFGADIIHRDYHDYNGYLYIVSDEGQGISTLKIVDLQYLPDSVSIVYNEDSLFSTSHNIFIDTAKAKLYTCGGNNNFGVRAFSLTNPIVPEEISSLSLPSSAHDIFVRNDTAYINDGTSGLRIYNFSDAANPILIDSLFDYPQKGYNHSGWLNEDGSIYVLADETHGTDLKILDVSDLSNITLLDTISSQIDHQYSIPHNVMVKGDNVFVSYYFDGLVIYNISDPSNPYISGYYDTSTETHANWVYRGCWGVYSFLPSGIVLASDMQNGLYVLDVTNATGISNNEDNSFNVIVFPNPASESVIISTKDYKNASYQIVNINGQMVKSGNLLNSIETIQLNAIPNGTYLIEISAENNKTITKKLVKSN
ncbi:MAG: choice-of-anchor B family protein [Flavobacteriales bacterium]|nr:choice-of-anchor B family protein [Flavobacteriales bacterium]